MTKWNTNDQISRVIQLILMLASLTVRADPLGVPSPSLASDLHAETPTETLLNQKPKNLAPLQSPQVENPQALPSPVGSPSVTALTSGPAAVGTEESSWTFFKGEWYFSWGYNRDYWAPTDIHISQPSLGNDFVVHRVQGVDFAQWDQGGLIFDKDFSVPQFNLRIGHFFNQDQDFAIEISLDHTKYSSVLDQSAWVTGTINGAPVSGYSTLSSSYFNYALHNGANHFMVNLLKRFPLLGKVNQNFTLSLLVKAGLGVMVPHAENTIFGNTADVGPKSLGNALGWSNGWWQFNGWTAGAEVAARFVVVKPIYIEFADKFAYANISNVPVYNGRADQILWMDEWNFSLGVLINSVVR